MLTRRKTLSLGIAGLGTLIAAPAVLSQSRPRVKVRYTEVIHSIFYAPAYVAMSKGYFDEAGIEVELATANAPDKLMAAIIGGSADIGLVGADAPIYVLNSESPIKARVFGTLTATDGFLLVGRENAVQFDWNSLKGKDILATLPGATPLMWLRSALRKHGIDPDKDVKLVSSVATPARVGAWLSGQYQFATFPEPDASQLEIDGKAHVMASIGQTVGPSAGTIFLATDKYLADRPEVVQGWINTIAKAQKWVAAAQTADIAEAVKPYFPAVAPAALSAGLERYKRIGIWKSTPAVTAAEIDAVQNVLVEGGVLPAAKRANFNDLVRPEFAAKAG